MADAVKTAATLLAEVPLKTAAAARAEWERIPIQTIRDLINSVTTDADGGEQFQDTQLTAAQVNLLMTANQEVVPAPASGYANIPTAIHMFLAHGGTDFVQAAATDQLALIYNGGSQLVEIGLAASFESFIEASADEAFYVNFAESALAATGALGITPVAATAIDIDNNGASELATGDGTLSIRVYYRTVPMAAFS